MGVASAMVGARVKRREDPRLITGHATYTDDMQPVGLLHVVMVRSPHAHANIKSINADAAKKVSGFRGILIGKDVIDAIAPLPSAIPGPEYRAIATDRVRYVGDIVAAVFAESRGAARDAADLVEVDYDVLPAVVDVEEGAKGKPIVIDPKFENNNGPLIEGGNDVSAAFESPEVLVEEKFYHQRLGPNSMEPRAALAEWRVGDDTLTLHLGTQNPHLLRTLISALMGIPEQAIRVVAPEVGGGFGTKITVYREELIACFAARKFGKPIKWIETRSEHLQASSQGRGQVDYVKLAATKDGRVTGLDIVAYSDMGAYFTLFTPAIPLFTSLVINGVYDIPNCHYKSYDIITNKTPTDAYRGAGRPEACFMIERMMDLLAAKLDMDPTEVRRKNFIPNEKFPYDSAMGLKYDSGDYAMNMDKALQIFDYQGMRKLQEEARAQGRYVGIGVSTYMEICGLGPSAFLAGRGWDSAQIRFEPTGKATVITGVSPHGQGQETTFAQIVADELGMNYEDVIVKHGDTANTAIGNGTYGSRGLAVGGPALLLACETIKEKAKKIAGFMLEANADDVVFEDQVLGKGYSRQEPQYKRDRGQSLYRHRHVWADRAGSGSNPLLRAGQPGFPLRHPHCGRRNRPRYGRRQIPQIRGGGRLRQADQPLAGRRTGSRRGCSGDRPGPF